MRSRCICVMLPMLHCGNGLQRAGIFRALISKFYGLKMSQRAAPSSKEKDGRKRTLQETFDETWHEVFQEHCKLQRKSTTLKSGQWTIIPAAN